jgi:hypothetical protein
MAQSLGRQRLAGRRHLPVPPSIRTRSGGSNSPAATRRARRPTASRIIAKSSGPGVIIR